MPTTIRLSTAEDLLTAIPYLVGYQPENSLVFLPLRGGQVQVTGRIDLPGGRPLPHDVVDRLVSHLAADECEAILLAGYGPATVVTTAVDAIREACAQHDIKVKEALRVTHGRYWFYLCPGNDCCPSDGEPVPAAESTIAAQFVAAGIPTLPDRDSVATQLDPAPARDLDTITTIIAAVRVAQHDSRAQARSLLHDHAARPEKGFPDIAETAIILAWLRLDDDLIDASLDQIDTTGPSHLLGLWIWLTRHAPTGYLAEPASVLAYAAWRAGNGTLARIAVERALSDAPHYGLAQLVGELLNTGANPITLPPLASFRSNDTA